MCCVPQCVCVNSSISTLVLRIPTFCCLVWDMEAELVFYCSSAEGVGGSCAHQIETTGIKIGSFTLDLFLSKSFSDHCYN